MTLVAPPNAPWRARLRAVQDRCLVAQPIDDALAGTLHLLVAQVMEAGEAREALCALIRRADELLSGSPSALAIAQWREDAAGILQGSPEPGA